MGLFSNPYSERKKIMLDKDQALYGRDEAMNISGVHFVNGNPIVGPFDKKYEIAYFALGCFWGAEKLFWKIEGVFSTAVGYQGGYTKNLTYEESCGGKTGHAETVMVVFDPKIISYENLVIKYFEGHDPTQYMGQGNDIGTEYRSAIFPTSQEQFDIAMKIKDTYSKTLVSQSMGEVTTEIYQLPTPPFYYAEEFHQQYLGKNPNGYCNLRGTGVSCAISS